MNCDLENLPVIALDEAFALTASFAKDKNPNKVSLGAGVYRDEDSKPYILPSVEKVCFVDVLFS